MIELKELSKRYGAQEVLHGLSFVAHPGQITLFIGANGVGKTTTLRILSGLLRPDGGDAWMCGHSVTRSRSAAQKALSYLPQVIAFHPRLTCEGILRFYAELRGSDLSQVPAILNRIGLADEARKPTGQLSGGLRQRLGLGVLLLADAPVLLLDEPGLSLDPEWRENLQEILRQEAVRGKTILVTTHLLAEWEGAADRALFCRVGGHVAEIDPCRLREQFLRTDAKAGSAQRFSEARR